ncbi:MAG: endonuclease MutS2 [Clostridiales bacterium]|nr:endonuclease MutS2 [Clostridiales bacterium]
MYKYTTFEQEAARKQIKGRVLSVLEYDKVIEKLLGCARTSYGRSLITELYPTTDPSVVRQSLQDTNEAFTYINKYGNLPIGTFPDLSQSLSYVKAGGTLTMRALLDISVFLRSIETLKKTVSGEHADMYGSGLFAAIESLEEAAKLRDDITFCIVNEDEMNDRASDELYSIRRQKKELAGNIRVLLDRVIRNSGDILQEAVITIRNDRYCVPLKAEYRSRLPGIVHDTSSTGQTIFVEPMNIVEINNKISELTSMEAAEIERILEELTAHVAKNSELLRSDAETVGLIDLASAKAGLAIIQNATMPALNTDGHIRLSKARHPLIDPEKVVPVDIINGKDYRTLVITGPNTGGKTVSLKTCGLLTLMTMAGLMIPAAQGSEVAVFDRVLADIGDEQSIEQSLSTFSAHVSNVVFILKNIKGRSLVLLDELGSGTDPAEGAALAVSILEDLLERGCVTMATTHYKELKAYALAREGVMNASCEFDTETLSPTYKLIIGTPGVSNAFVISRKLGLPRRLIDDAKERLTGDELSFEQLLADADRNNREAEALRNENLRLNEELKEKTNELAMEKAALKASKTKILNDMRREEREALEEKIEELDDMIRKLRKKSSQQDKRDAAEEMERVRKRLRAGLKDISDDSHDEAIKDTVMPGEPPKVVKEGEMYYVPHLDIIGKVISAGGKKIRIGDGPMTYQVTIDQLREPSSKQKENAGAQREAANRYTVSSAGKMKYAKAMETMPEINLIGKTVAEAESALDSYIDDCQLAGIKSIRIVHGKGTGALRSAVDTMLRGDTRVRSHRLGIQGEGDDGVTIASLN